MQNATTIKAHTCVLVKVAIQGMDILAMTLMNVGRRCITVIGIPLVITLAEITTAPV